MESVPSPRRYRDRQANRHAAEPGRVHSAGHLLRQPRAAFYREDEDEALELLLEALHLAPTNLHIHYLAALCADLLSEEAPQQFADTALRELGEVDFLINLAGILNFALFQNETAQSIERMWRINVIAPMQLTRILLPHMLARGSGKIVNIGSVFGTIGFAFFTCYSANKFAMRGFSQALRRELEGTGVGVTYIAPRYTRTPINSGPVSRMSEALKMNMELRVQLRHPQRPVRERPAGCRGDRRTTG